MHHTTDDSALDLDAMFQQYEEAFGKIDKAIAESQDRCERAWSEGQMSPGEVEIATLLRHQTRTQLLVLQQLVLMQGTIMSALEAFAQEEDDPS